ncbi:hypothetical protein PMIN01_05236 [Paraphaeosphaeria minitans]|uniref:Uncharacterized protein n=1 Tax=Paraphaeosphaeria minitans TaxID=565426 RepID=A0A9P6GKS2_9PLEO|nr:hypothetical protein PMIN01_05236 [Paraphaeosphaeria minitans]
MYWTTSASSRFVHLRSPPLPTSPAEYIHAIHALSSLTTPLSAQLLPLLTVYTASRAAQAPSPTYLFSLDEQIAHAELEELYARIVLLWRDMYAHYAEFCYFYGEKDEVEVWGMVREIGESAGVWTVWLACLGKEWEDLRWLLRDRAYV